MEEIILEIERLKREKQAILLAHVYQPKEIQAIADFTGDSFALSKKAAETDAKVLVFCGVRFMAETANILSPEKVTLLPAENAGCRMFDDTLVEEVQRMRKLHKDAVFVSYVNTPAVVKAMSDICCTSSNAVEVVKSLPKDRKVVFLPDGNLGHFVQEKAGREIVCWQGGCPVHAALSVEELLKVKAVHPKAVVLAHPECSAEVCKMADYVGSTMGILHYAEACAAEEFIVATECGVMYELKRRCPEKHFYMASQGLVCEDMKETTLEKVRDALLTLKPRVVVPKEIQKRAERALKGMLEIMGDK